jgi:hypothetical protein
MSRPNLIQQPVEPSECALAIGVPITREAFLRDLEKPDLKDYASHFKRANFLSGVSSEYYGDLFEASAKVARRVCDEVEALGVSVVRWADLSNLSKLLSQFKVVTLVTHWCFMELGPEDILDLHQLWMSLSTPSGRVHLAVARAVSEEDPTLLAATNATQLESTDIRLRLANALTTIVAASHRPYKTSDETMGAETGGASNKVLERLTRVELEQSFAGLIAPGKSVEFSDCMRGVNEIVAGVPATFDGLLDLTTCNSVILGKAIKSSRPNCVVAMNRYGTPLHVRMPLYKLVIEDLARRPAPYADTLSRFHKN